MSDKQSAKFFCENCGAEVPEHAKVCKNCGKFFISVRCPKCGKVGTTDTFKDGCPVCGYAVGKNAPTPKKLQNKKPLQNKIFQKKHWQRNGGEQSLPLWVYVLTFSFFALMLTMVIKCIRY